eukprot:Skav213960  [mRNA]  locus=scaffold1979:333159:334082:+ [translate_table: standard]
MPASTYAPSGLKSFVSYRKLATVLMAHSETFIQNKTVYLMVDTRLPGDVGHWPAFAPWWYSRRQLQGPYLETVDVVWIRADEASGLDMVPYVWAGTFVLEMARFMYPHTHKALIDNDSVPLTLFEVDELVKLADTQPSLDAELGRRQPATRTKMLLFTEPHFDLNAGLVISVGTSYPPDYKTHTRSAEEWEQLLKDSRNTYLAITAAPPNPTAAALSGLVYTPLLGTMPKTALDLTHAWALLGLFCIDRYWPIPATRQTESSFQTAATSSSVPTQWPRHASSTHLTTSQYQRLQPPTVAYSMGSVYL